MTVPDSDHVARHCKPTTIDKNGKLLPPAFMLRPNDEYLSVNWLEYLQCADRENEVRGVLAAYSAKGFNPKKTSKIAVINVGDVRQKVQIESPDGRNLNFRHMPTLPVDPSHSGIFGMMPEQELIAEIIVQLVRDSDIYPIGP